MEEPNFDQLLRVIKNLKLEGRHEARLQGWSPKTYFFSPLLSQSHAFSSQLKESLFSSGTRALKLWVIWMSFGPQSSSFSYSASAPFPAALAQALTPTIQPDADASFLTSFRLPRYFSVPGVSSILSLSTSLPSPPAP